MQPGHLCCGEIVTGTFTIKPKSSCKAPHHGTKGLVQLWIFSDLSRSLSPWPLSNLCTSRVFSESRYKILLAFTTGIAKHLRRVSFSQCPEVHQAVAERIIDVKASWETSPFSHFLRLSRRDSKEWLLNVCGQYKPEPLIFSQIPLPPLLCSQLDKDGGVISHYEPPKIIINWLHQSSMSNNNH